AAMRRDQRAGGNEGVRFEHAPRLHLSCYNWNGVSGRARGATRQSQPAGAWRGSAVCAIKTRGTRQPVGRQNKGWSSTRFIAPSRRDSCGFVFEAAGSPYGGGGDGIRTHDRGIPPITV